MTVTNLKKVLDHAVLKNIGTIGFVVQGWEDARAFVNAGSTLKTPVILQAGPVCRRHTPLSVLGKMFRILADASDQDVVLHLDHATDLETCQSALDEGFTSIMFDGSRLALSENIKLTQKASLLAKPYKASLEAEIGYVGYSQPDKNVMTDALDVREFISEVEIDALAISVGNTHIQEKHQANIDYSNLKKINELTKIPLVVHGTSGIAKGDRRKMLKFFGVKKFNIGTELRQQFGFCLRKRLNSNLDQYDRIKILSAVEKDLLKAAMVLLKEISL